MKSKNQNTETTEDENIVFAALEEAVKAFDESPVILRSVVLNIGIEVDNDQATAQLDFAVVTEAGVFLIEAKGWRGNVFNDPESVKRILLEEFGNTVSKLSPIEQAKRKRKFLQARMPNVRFHSLGVISGTDSKIDHKVKANIIHVNELAVFLRGQATAQRSENERIAENPSYAPRKTLDTSIEDVSLRILALSDTSEDADANHLKNCLHAKFLKIDKILLTPKAQKIITAKKALVESVNRAKNLGMTQDEILVELEKCLV